MGDARALIFPGQCRTDYPSNQNTQARYVVPAVPEMGPTITAPGNTDEEAGAVLLDWFDSASAEKIKASLDVAEGAASAYIQQYRSAIKYFEEGSLLLADKLRSKINIVQDDLNDLLTLRRNFDARLKGIFVPLRKFSVIAERDLEEYERRIIALSAIDNPRTARNLVRKTGQAIASPKSQLTSPVIQTELKAAEKLEKIKYVGYAFDFLSVAARFMRVYNLEGLQAAWKEAVAATAGKLLGGFSQKVVSTAAGKIATAVAEEVAGSAIGEALVVVVGLTAGEFVLVTLLPIGVGIYAGMEVEKLVKVQLN